MFQPECPVCGERFVRRDRMISHVRERHPADVNRIRFLRTPKIPLFPEVQTETYNPVQGSEHQPLHIIPQGSKNQVIHAVSRTAPQDSTIVVYPEAAAKTTNT